MLQGDTEGRGSRSVSGAPCVTPGSRSVSGALCVTPGLRVCVGRIKSWLPAVHWGSCVWLGAELSTPGWGMTPGPCRDKPVPSLVQGELWTSDQFGLMEGPRQVTGDPRPSIGIIRNPSLVLG